ncbi:MAG TPA: methyltransferase domain-containing protein [Anaerolineales bacterium]|nr:methyltransferase domain-containing protein [Anaerolineales bacterium]
MRLLTGFLRFFFRHLYTTLAPAYDLIAWTVSMGQWNQWVRTALVPLPAGPVLELGHGTGHLLQEMAVRGIPAFGLDRSRQMSRLAHRRLSAGGAPIRLVRADAQALPFPDRHFQSALSTFPPEFALDPLSLSEARRVLAPGAGLLIVVQAQITGESLPDRLAAWLFGVTGQYAELRPEWTGPISRAGFLVERRDLRLPRARVVRIWAERPT